MNSRLLKRNRIQCVICDDIIESKQRHDFVKCTCGNCFIDGGLEYSRYGYYGGENSIINMSEYYPTPKELKEGNNST